ncbi:MAG TPA: LysR family transcriptional regulator [Bryobacteraceae bacterium]|nr:LysR family transcriptional regulator [Bryobacteraceae bacterium]
MDLHQLRVFHAAVTSGGFSRAGDQLHLSQSTVSQHIKLLESEVGCQLFLRVGKRVQVTEAGKVLLPYAERIFRDLKNAEMALREMSELRRGTVRLGVGPTTLIYRLPPVLSEYQRRFPEIEIFVLAGTTEFLLQELRSQRIDLAIVMPTGSQPGVSVKPLGREELVIVVNRDHPFAKRHSIEPAELSTLRLILYEKNTAMQNLVDSYFESLRITPNIAMEVENNEAIKSLVRAGLGSSILPLCAVANEPPDGALRILRVKGKPLIRHLQLASAAADVFPKAIEELAFALTSALTPPGVDHQKTDRQKRSALANESIGQG